MGAQIVWKERYNIGVASIDEEHRKLFGIIDRLLVGSKQKDKLQWVCQEGIKYFKNFAIKHYAEEEEYMRSIRYEGYDVHKRIHDNFRYNTLPALEKELERKQYSEDAVNHFLSVCAGWLISHTLTEDHAIAGKTASKWKELLPEEESSAVGQVLIQILYEVFRLESRVISEAYGGEKFDKGIYYRLAYRSQEGGKWEIFLAYDDKILLNTVGRIMGFHFEKVNSTVINATRYMARQFMERVKDYFPSVELHELKEENLLNYRQFKEKFDEESPRCSLLFDTSEGYFAFCVVAPSTLEKGIGFAIKEDNAMESIKAYLSQNVASLKRKVLVVDDSKVARKMMVSLLEKDYQVEEADSGLAAIRCILLNRPQLVLLDYEMPICDGVQVMEMIRAEKDFADIPIIFLTGRGDADTVKKVMRLKPAGYLLKALKPEEIKQNIDSFFEKQNI